MGDGISGQPAPQWSVPMWVDGYGEPIEPVTLAGLGDRLRVVYCFQAWCEGCHSHGFPALKQMVEAFEGDDSIAFVAVQTVFEGFEENTFDKMVEVQKQYGLGIPFGHDPGDEQSGSRSDIMDKFETGGTPWFIFIGSDGRVLTNGFHIDVELATRELRKLTEATHNGG